MRKQGVLVGPGASAGPAPRGPDSFEHPALPPDGLGLSLWENQGVQPPCSPFTGKQTTPQASNCPRSQPSNCSGGAHNVLDATSAPPGAPTTKRRGSGPEAQPPSLQSGERGQELPGNPGRRLQVGARTQTRGDFSNPVAWRRDSPGNRTNWVGGGSPRGRPSSGAWDQESAVRTTLLGEASGSGGEKSPGKQVKAGKGGAGWEAALGATAEQKAGLREALAPHSLGLPHPLLPPPKNTDSEQQGAGEGWL